MKNTLFFLKAKRMGKFSAPTLIRVVQSYERPKFNEKKTIHLFANGQVQKRPVGQAWSLSTSAITMLIGSYQAQPTSHY